MAKAWFTFTLPAAIWLAAAAGVVTGFANQAGAVGVLLWAVFLLGILYVLVQMFGYDHL